MSALTLEVSAKSTRYTAGHTGWLQQSGNLWADLRRSVNVDHRPKPGTHAKGALSEAIVTVVSTGALTAMIDVIRVWLDRDKTRFFEVAYTVGDTRKHLRVDSDALESREFETFVQGALAQLEGLP